MVGDRHHIIWEKVATYLNYDYYIGETKMGKMYNIKKKGSKEPTGGYYDKHLLLAKKHLPDKFLK